MSLCASCGLHLPEGVVLCPHHHAAGYPDDWSDGNRAWGNFIHRQIVMPRDPNEEPFDEWLRRPVPAASVREA